MTPEPYYAVIFTSERTAVDDGYGVTADRMVELASRQPGFLGVESARDDALGITVSYWESKAAIAAWKREVEHLDVQRKGREKWYRRYRVRIARVEREYGYEADASDRP